jgi:hypothetical protein
MNLKSDGVFIAIIILISMMLICHTAHFFYDRNKFSDVTGIPTHYELPTQYNQIFYEGSTGSCNNSKPDQAVLDQLLGQANVPCPIVTKQCPIPTNFSLDNLSESELAVIYKVAYENAGMEVLNRALQKQI